MTALNHLYPELNDDGKLHQRFLNKRVNALKEGIEFHLAFDEFADLLRRAAIVSSQCGIKGYHLARTNDAGPYAVGNCSFKWYLSNLNEKVMTEAMRDVSRNNIQSAHRQAQSRTEQERAAYASSISSGILASSACKARKAAAGVRRAAYEANAHKSYKGDRNSQHGTFWITDGTKNKKWHENKGDMPPLFYRGRVRNF